MLTLHNVATGYGNSRVLFGIDMEIRPGAVTTLLGRNGMGKTTTVNAIIGNLPCYGGEIRFNGELLNGLPPYRIARKGIALAPEGRQIFPNLSVRENLIATAANYHKTDHPWTLERVMACFPLLKARLNHMGNQLSGGEQQMLSIGRALMLNPSLLILDEATEGLAPLIRREIWQRLVDIRNTGIAILLIDKNLHDIAQIADRHYIIEKGQIAWSGDSSTLLADPTLTGKYLGF